MRLIDSGSCSAELNMAIDESLFSTFDCDTAEPVLRLYTWNRPCLTLGYFQRAADAVRRDACRERGVDVVRRITGGRAVLHDQELTYCIVAPVKRGPFAGRLIDCYQAIATCLAESCEQLGISKNMIEVVTGARGGSASAACFMMASAYEIMVGGRKLIGSAQKRNDDVFVQHGSIPLRIDMPLTLSVMRLEENSPGGGAGLPMPSCLEELAGRPLEYDEVKKAIKEGFRLSLEEEVVPSDLSEQEARLAGELAREKYGTDAWNFRR
ncbi:MAG: lipoate--protein ligase family protein [Candidatus Coatesbacteria bacterium]|nr:lipoate--protein ligase family protein [Candidatus Coatesbacteria bacterium]